MRAEKQARPKAALDCYNYKVNSLKSLNREVVTSAALFTRLMPRCTQEGVNQARGYTHCLEPASSSSRSFPVLLGTGTRLHHAMAALTEMKAGCLLDTLVHYTQFEYDDRGLGRVKTFRASMRSAAAVCRELCMAKPRIIL